MVVYSLIKSEKKKKKKRKRTGRSEAVDSIFVNMD